MPRARPRAHGPDVRRAIAGGDGGGVGGVCGSHTAGDPLRLPLGIDSPRRGRLRARHLGRRVPVPGGRVRDRRHRAVEGADPGRRARGALRGHRRPASSTGAGASSSSASATPGSRSRAGCSPGPRGSCSPRRGPSTLRRSAARRYGRATCSRSTSTPAGERAPTSSTRRSSGSNARTAASGSSRHGTTWPGELFFEVDDVLIATGFRTPLRDLPALGLADGRRRPDPGADPLLRERHRAGHLLRGQRVAGLFGAAQAGSRSQLDLGQRVPLQRAHPGPPHRGDAVRQALERPVLAGSRFCRTCCTSSRSRPSSGCRRGTWRGP